MDLPIEQALLRASEAPPATRIDFRDPIARYGDVGIAAVRPWLRHPDLAAFAIRVIVRAGEMGATPTAVHVLAVESKTAMNEVVLRDLREGLDRLGARRAPVRKAAVTSGRRAATPADEGVARDLTRGRSYRRRDLHAAGWGGNRQSGISYPAGGDHALLFSDPSKSIEHGYRDRWVGDVYHYYGAWSGTGDMVLAGANQALLDRSPNLHVLVRNGDLWRYEGQFECVGHEPERTVRDGREFRAIVFLLRTILETK